MFSQIRHAQWEAHRRHGLQALLGLHDAVDGVRRIPVCHAGSTLHAEKETARASGAEREQGFRDH